MKRIKFVGLALVAVCAISVVAAAGASAHNFTASEVGALTGKSLQTQRFHTSAGNVECTALKATGTSALKSLTQEASVSYTGCTAFGLAAKVSTVKYLFNADGTASVLNTVTITATACTVTVPSSKNQNLGLLKYKTVGKLVELEPTVKGITSTGTGAACTYAEESNGTYGGNSNVGLANGTGSVGWE